MSRDRTAKFRDGTTGPLTPETVKNWREQIAAGKTSWSHYAMTKALDALEAERTKVNTPQIHDFVEAVRLEAAHQRERWGSDHDAGKTDADWHWLIGFLSGKALHNPGGDAEKQLHRIITIAAAAANWHAAKLGKTDMRPGIETPNGEA